MPSGTKKDKEKTNILTTYLDGKYAPYNGPYVAERVMFDLTQAMEVIDPDLQDEMFDFYNSTYVGKARPQLDKPPVKGLYTAQNMSIMDNVCEDLDAEYEMLKYSRKIDKKMGEFIDNLEGTGLEFKEYFKALKSNSDLESGDITRAINDSSVVYGMRFLITYGPKIKTKKILKTDAEINEEAIEKNIPVSKVKKERTEFDFDKMKEGLGQVFLPYMEMIGDYNTLVSLEYEKQKLEDEHAGAEAEADFKERYKAHLEKFVKDFKTLRQVEIDNPHVYGDTFLNNSLDHLVGVSPNENRSIEKEIAFMEGQAKAIENGWPLEAINILGLINSNVTYLEKAKGMLDYTIKQETDTYTERNQRLAEVRKELEPYSVDVHLTIEEMDELRKPYKKELEAYETFASKLKEMENAGKSYDEQLQFKNDNIGVLMDYAMVDAKLREETGIDGLNRYYELKTEEKRLYDQISYSLNRIQTCQQRLPLIEQGVEEARQLKEESFNKKINNINDSRDILYKLENYNAKYHDVYGDAGPLGEAYFDSFPKMIAGIKERFEKGRVSELGAEAASFHMNKIYGSTPALDKKWEKGKFKKEQGEKLIPYDAKGLPFNEMEITALGVGGSLEASDPGVAKAFSESRFSNEQNGVSLKEGLMNSMKFWTLDANDTTEGPRDDFGKYADIVEAGRQYAKKAMEKYVEGDKRPLAMCIYNGCFSIQKNLKSTASLGDYSSTYTVLLDSYKDMMKRDPDLLNEVKLYNAKLPENERLDFERLDRMKDFSRTVLQGRNAREELEKGNDLTPLKKLLLTKKAIKGEVFNALVYTDMLLVESDASIYLSTPEGKKKLDKFVNNMIDKYDVKPGEMTGTDHKDSAIFRAEINRFNNEIKNEKLLKRLDEDPNLTPEQMKDIAVQFVKNNHYIENWNRDIEKGRIDAFNNYETRHMKHDFIMQKRVKFDDAVKQYVDQMNIGELDGKALAEKLKGLSDNGKMYKRSSQIEASVGREIEKRPETQKAFTDQTTELDKAYNTLKRRNMITGKKDYDDCLTRFEALIKDIKRADREYAETGIYPKEEFLDREQQLMDDMQKYINRKQKEFDAARKLAEETVKRKMHILTAEERKTATKEVKEANDAEYDRLFKKYYDKEISKAADKRHGAMVFAHAELSRRRMLDYCRPEASAQALQLANEYTTTQPDFTVDAPAKNVNVQVGPAVNPVKKSKKPEKVLDVLEELIKHESKLRNKCVEKDKENVDIEDKKYSKTIIDSAYRSLYLEVLKDDYLKKPHVPEEVEKKNLETLRKNIIEGFKNPDNLKAFNTMRKSAFGEDFSARILNSKEELSHENILKLRDQALDSEYIKAYNDYKEARKINVDKTKAKNACEQIAFIGKALGSNVLDEKTKKLDLSNNPIKLKTDISIKPKTK